MVHGKIQMLTIAYLGPEKTNTHLAALKQFGARSRYVHAPTIDDVFYLVERRESDYGVVPIENSLEGAVTHTLDRFIDFVDTPVKIHGEIEQPIRHHLIVHRGTKLNELRAVYSHPQALAQCHHWLIEHMPYANRRETNSTADAVAYVLHDKNKRTRAAIGREELAKPYGLQAIAISDRRENKTRFLIIGLGQPERGRSNKTSILFALKDKPGALHDTLVPFKKNRINLTKIESRPSKRKAWEYLFFIDVEGHESEPRVKRAIEALKRSTSLLRVLGSYPTATSHGHR
jgi:chorismate mutase/prephenate dehydratase